MGRLRFALPVGLCQTAEVMKSHHRILLLGGGGFLGQALAKTLLSNGYEVSRLDFRPISPLGIQDRVFVGDLSNPDFIQPLLTNCHTLIHLASATTPSTSATSPFMEVGANIGPTLRLLELAQQPSLKHLIFISSGGTVYGNPERLPAMESDPSSPLSYHAAGKVALESFLHAYRHLSGKVVTILRPSNIYGPEQPLRSGFGIIRTMLENARADQPLTIWGDGENMRDYLYIDDMIAACCKLITRGCDNDTFNVGAGTGTSINQLRQAIEKIIGKHLSVKHLPARPLDVRGIVLDSTKLAHATGWAPQVSLEEGIMCTWQWLKNQQ